MKKKWGIFVSLIILLTMMGLTCFPTYLYEFKKHIYPRYFEILEFRQNWQNITLAFWRILGILPLQTSHRSAVPPMPLSSAQIMPKTIETMLKQKDNHLNPDVIRKVRSTLHCAQQLSKPFSLLTIIDYSLPANEKRFWIFDLKHKKRLFYTYVSHGLRSGILVSTYFSNQNNSKASSLGVYYAEKAYFGRHGLSLKLNGLETGFNDNAENRFIVMHGSWYVNEDFIKKYGRPGRSWGCPAVPNNLVQPIIDTIKEQSLLVIYYPDEPWLKQSKFLNCHNQVEVSSQQKYVAPISITPEVHDVVFFANIHKSRLTTEHQPILAMPVAVYERLFHTAPPLSRMLRRQVYTTEYIALNHVELNQLATTGENLTYIHFIIPEIKIQHGYYGTEMKKLALGPIKAIQHNTLYFDHMPPIQLIAVKKFIRWVGL